MSLEPKSRLGHYEIVSPLGAGGMGEVYRARDPKLEREVAIKVLPADFAADPERLARFEREAKALAALNHPNVATVHGFEKEGDTHFLVMELVEGEELAERIRRGPIPVEEAVGLFIQIAEGLEAAHEKGIVHRDLKPANVKVTEKGRVKVLDFGLAKALEPPRSGADLSESPTMTAAATMRGEILGTAAYMSPEQAQGSAVDARSDIWSFGVCLLEALVGKRAFQGENVSMVMASVLKDEPPLDALPKETPEGVRRVLRRCLTRDLPNRLQAIGDARVELAESLAERKEEPPGPKRGWNWWRLAAGLVVLAMVVATGWFAMRPGSSSEAIDSLVVLPLEAAEDVDAQYLGDGIAQNLINQLSLRDELRVIASSTAFSFRDRGLTPQELGERLEVRALLSGRVQRLEDQIQIQVELVDCSDGSQLWGEQFRGTSRGLVTLQETVTRQVLERLRPELAAADLAIDLGTSSSEALELVMRASSQTIRGTRESAESAIRDYEAAIALAPDYALAHAGLAWAYASLRAFGFGSASSIEVRWREAAERAVQLDDSLPEAWVQLASLTFSYEWDWLAAGEMYRKALELEPDSARLHGLYALYLMMFDPPRAVEVARRGVELDPNSAYRNRLLAQALRQNRQLDQSIEQYQKTLRMDPSYAAAVEGFAWVYIVKGSPDEAIELIERRLGLSEDTARNWARLALAQAMTGDRAPAESIVASRGLTPDVYLPWVDVARLHLVLGDHGAALDALEAAADEREWLLVWLKKDLFWDGLRDEPRFQALIERIGFPEPEAP